MNIFKLWLTSLLFALIAGCSNAPPSLPEPGPLMADVPNAPMTLDWRLNLNLVSQADGRGLAINMTDDRAFVATSSGMLTALVTEPQARYSDQVIWQARFEAPLIAGPALDASGLYVGTAKGDVIHIHSETGETIWQTHVNSEVVAQPVVTEYRVVIRTNDGRILALNKLDGQVVWIASAQMPNLFLRGAAPVLIEGEQVFVGRENGIVEALSLVTGETLWQARLAIPSGRTDLERMVDIQAQLVYDQGRLFALAYNGRLAAINTRTGNFIWTRPLSGAKDFIFENNRLIISSDDQVIRAIDASSGTEIWNQTGLVGRLPGHVRSIELKNESVAMLVDGFGYLHWLSLVDGRLFARFAHVDHLDRGRTILVSQVKQDQYLLLDRNGQLTQYLLDLNHFPAISEHKESNE